MKSQLFNLLLYEAGWFACVVGAARGWSLTGAGIALALVAVHVLLVTDRWPQIRISLAAAAVGFMIESALTAMGVYRFSTASGFGVLPPLWVLMLWVQFATLLPFCLRWVSGRYWLAALLGFTGGPLAFLAGERIGAVTFLEPRALQMVILGIGWAVAFPLLVKVSDSVLGVSRKPSVYAWGRRD